MLKKKINMDNLTNDEFYNYLNINYIEKKYKASKPALFTKHIKERNYIEIINFLLTYVYMKNINNKT
jgi:hypothetical protein